MLEKEKTYILFSFLYCPHVIKKRKIWWSQLFFVSLHHEDT